MVRVGIVGVGFMGMIHYLTYRKLPGVQVTALCELNAKRLAGDWTDIRGNFGPPGEQMDLSGVATFTRLEDMLQSDLVDLIDVTLPPDGHAAATVAALQSGRHVFCEKPMSLRLDQCDAMLAAAEEAKRLLFVGHVLPFFPEYAWAWEAVRSGRYGRLLGGAFRRVIADPAWLPRYWSAEQVGGPLFDLHVHDAHFIRLLFGMPGQAITRGRSRHGLPEHWTTQFCFADPQLAVSATSGVVPQQGRSFDHGFEIHCEQATLQFEFAVFDGAGRYLCPPTILAADGSVASVELGSGDPMNAFQQELGSVLECVRTGQPSDLLDGRLARDAIEICQMEADDMAAANATPPSLK